MKSQTKSNNFQSSHLLRYFFDQKKRLHPQYSLRALSRDLKLSQSYVSEIFSGKKIPSAEKIQLLSQTLGMDAFARKSYEEAFFKDLFPSQENSKWEEKKWQPVVPGDGSVLRKWYFLVVLDLVDCKNFKNDPAWIATRIGIKTQEAAQAIEWLLTNKFLIEKKGCLKKSSRKVRFHTSKSMPEIRAWHKQMMELASLELTQKTDKKSFERRLITGITFSCNPKKLEAAKKRLLEAIYSVSEDLMEGDCSDVYQINLQLFPHTRE